MYVGSGGYYYYTDMHFALVYYIGIHVYLTTFSLIILTLHYTTCILYRIITSTLNVFSLQILEWAYW